MGSGIGVRMESHGSKADGTATGTQLRLFGPLTLLRDGAVVPLPPSRKVRLLIAYLSLSAHPLSRERLCELFWDVPNDPRSELRWCLSKLRGLLDEPGRLRVLTDQGRVALDLEGYEVDALRVLAAAATSMAAISRDDLQALLALFGGDFLDGIAAEGSPDLQHWLAGRRSEFRSLRTTIIAEIGRRSLPGTPEGLVAARDWLENAPHDVSAHQRFLMELLHRQMIEEGNRHIDAAARTFAAENVDFAPLRAAWAAMRGNAAPAFATVVEAGPHGPLPGLAQQAPTRRASVAVMPFTEGRRGQAGRGELGNALTHDIISQLARLRSLFVIARGSVFAIAQEELGLREIGARLAVDYVATGHLERHGDTLSVAVEVAEAATSHILWTDTLEAAAIARMPLLDDVCDGIVSSIAAEIENAERNRAMLKPADSLDAWECYHRGLWHMYNFTAEENARAADFFQQSIRLDPTFSRSWAGLSFTHWQSAFQRWEDRDVETRHALEAAGRSLLGDSQNPAAHWAMGRALWLSGDADEATRALQESIHLSPNFALGHYAMAFVQSQSGDPEMAIAASDHSRLLSPCDPLLFGMLGSRALALVRLGRYEEASDWSLKAAARPNAHVHILAIAAHCLALAGRLEDARAHAARIRHQSPGYDVEHFLDTFRFDGDAQAAYRSAARMIGLAS